MNDQMFSSSIYFFGPAPFSLDIINPVNHLEGKNIINLLSEVCYFIFLEAFLHHKSYSVDMTGFSVFLRVSPIVLNAVDATVWHQSKIR